MEFHPEQEGIRIKKINFGFSGDEALGPMIDHYVFPAAKIHFYR